MTAALKRLAWYKNRIAAMSAREILYRIYEFSKRRIDRFHGNHFIAAVRDCGTLPQILGLRAGLMAWQIPDQLLQRWSELAHEAKAGNYLLLNQKWPPHEQEDTWQLDPVSGASWPRDAYCFSINYRHAAGRGDIKLVWDLNRLQHLQPVAALACKKNDAELAQFCLNAVEDWIDRNPPFRGVNWCSGIELTLRMISILTITTLAGEHLSRALRGKIWATLETHARWLARYPSRYSSANNHRLAEGLGLFMIGALCPHFAEAGKWKQGGWDILLEASRLQILPDGANAEQTVAYTAFALEMLLTGLKIAQATDMEIPSAYIRKITLGGEFLRWLTDADGNQPRIGDDDNASVFGVYRYGDDYVSSIAACVAAVTGRADIAPPKTQPHFRQAVFGFAPAPDFTPYGTRCFTHAGLTVGRHKTANGDALVAFDHGYLGYLSIAAHGHADALALWLHIDGQPVFVDAGTYMYHAQENERRSFRSTAAHNTLMLEDTDSSIMAGNFNWSHKASTLVLNFTSRGDFWHIEAEHDGYQDAFQTTHRRSLSVSPATGAVIEDILIGPVPRKVSINFLLHPDLTARREGSEVTVMKGERLVLRLRHESGLMPVIGMPGTPASGWYSPAFGIKQPATRLSFSGILAPAQAAVTHIFWAN